MSLNHFLIPLTEATFPSIFPPKSQYKLSQMLLRLKPQMCATYRCKVVNTFSTIFTTTTDFNLTMVLVAKGLIPSYCRP